MYSIECYDEKEFITKYKSVYQEFLKQSWHMGINISQYYFSQYLKWNHAEDVTYVNVNNENVSFNIQWYKGNIEDVSVTMD